MCPFFLLFFVFFLLSCFTVYFMFSLSPPSCLSFSLFPPPNQSLGLFELFRGTLSFTPTPSERHPQRGAILSLTSVTGPFQQSPFQPSHCWEPTAPVSSASSFDRTLSHRNYPSRTGESGVSLQAH